MGGRTWVTADLHLGHANIIKFLDKSGNRIRPFNSIEDHDETIIRDWNNLVDPGDRVYVLGDVVINRRALASVSRLAGRKVLVKGNHDIFHLEDYIGLFDDIRAYVVQKDGDGSKVIMSHIPIHPDSLDRFGTNIHGHLHQNKIENDKRYVCVSLEHTDFKPIQVFEALKLR